MPECGTVSCQTIVRFKTTHHRISLVRHGARSDRPAANLSGIHSEGDSGAMSDGAVKAGFAARELCIEIRRIRGTAGGAMSRGWPVDRRCQPP